MSTERLPTTLFELLAELRLSSRQNKRVIRAIALQRLEPMLQEIMAQSAIKQGLLIEDILPPARTHDVVRALHEFYYRALTETSASLPLIGRIAARDHTSVLYGVSKHAFDKGLPLPRGMDGGRYYRQKQKQKRGHHNGTEEQAEAAG